MVRSKAFDCYAMSAAYKGISRETQIDFSTVIAFLDRMPTFLNGAAHRQKRSDLARLYGRKTEALKEAVLHALSNVTAGMIAHHGTFDVLNDLARPLWRAVARTFLPEHLPYAPEMEDLPDLFTPQTSLVKRKRCEHLLRDLVRQHGNGILDDLALITLGARPFVNGFALSIHALAEQHRGQSLDAIPYPERFPESGLRYVDRIATNPRDVPAGARYRCVIVDRDYPAEQNATNLFGMGPHVCIGRQISLIGWEGLCARLAKIQKVVAPGPLRVVKEEPFENVVECKIKLGLAEN